MPGSDFDRLSHGRCSRHEARHLPRLRLAPPRPHARSQVAVAELGVVRPLDAITKTEKHQTHNTRNQMKEHHSIARIGDTLICSGTLATAIPSGGSHVRQVEVRLPKFVGEPSVTATIFSQESPGNAFAIWDIKINDLGGQTQVAISACNVQTGQPVPYTYYCSYVVIGKSHKSE